ncbi:hypothetical protein NST63_14920 [Heyndrickxia sp. FSL W8-0496]|uniref:hypothetical protein n=1 Tax=Heyndrickxia TaxID=2837504 RepID=UPI0030F58671
MRKVYFIIFIILLAGCQSESTTKKINIKNDNNKSQAIQTKEIDEEELEKEAQAAKTYFAKMIEAIDDNNRKEFLSFQNEKNKLFYKEQDAWILGVYVKRKEGVSLTTKIRQLELTSLTKGNLTLQIDMKNKDKIYSNQITYTIIKKGGKWKINDLPFKKMTNGPINLYYLPSLEYQAAQVMKDLKKLVDLYIEYFDWDPKEVNVKLYDSLEELSASVPWETVPGVSQSFISLKFFVDTTYSDVTYNIMKHEVVHTMLAEISNDNATEFMHEGLAIYISSAVSKDPQGNPRIDLNGVKERENILLDNIKTFKPINELNNINYTNDSGDIYSLGFLLTDYLISNYGMDKYLNLLSELKKEDIVDNYNEEKQQIVYKRVIKAMEKIYAPIDQLSKDYADYFNKLKQ